MNGYDALHLLKKGLKVRRSNWKKGWYIFINSTELKTENIETFFVDYSPKMKEDLETYKKGDKHKYSDVIEDLIYYNWETVQDDWN